MNESQSTPVTNTSSSAENTKKDNVFVEQTSPTPAKKTSTTILSVAVCAVIVGLAASWWLTHQNMQNLRTEVAQQLHTEGTNNTEMKGVLKSVQDSGKTLEGKVSVLENKQIESQSQQLALEQLYQDLSKNRDDWMLSEIGDILATANQQLQLAGNVKGALIALDTVDKSLARVDKPQFIAIRRAIANDEARLKAVPDIDVTGIAIRIDNVLAQVDTLPLLLDEKTGEIISGGAAEKASVIDTSSDAAALSSWDKTKAYVADVAGEAWVNLKELVYIRRVDKPDALLLSPSQAYFVRENLKLRLLSARLALLSRNEFVFKNDLKSTTELVNKYFNGQDKQVLSVLEVLKQVQENNLSIQIPTLSESMNAVHSYNNSGQR